MAWVKLLPTVGNEFLVNTSSIKRIADAGDGDTAIWFIGDVNCDLYRIPYADVLKAIEEAELRESSFSPHTPYIFKENINNYKTPYINSYTEEVEVGKKVNNREKVEEEKKKEKKEKKDTRFIPPTIEEVSNYCNEQNYHIDIEKFFDYYEVQGWKLKNGNPMKNWQAAVRNWWRNDKSGVFTPKKKKTFFEELNDLTQDSPIFGGEFTGRIFDE